MDGRRMTGHRPAVSVLLSTRNERPDLLDVALTSLCAQELRDFEIVLIDDGSTEQDTISALDRWATRDERIRLFREPHRGLTKSLNIGLSYCRADLIARHDSDDWSSPQRLARQVEFLDRNPRVALVGSQVMFHMEDGRPLWKSQLPQDHAAIVAALPRFNPFCHGATMFRREQVLKVGGYRESLPCSQDYDLFWRLSEQADAANLGDVLYHHRRSSRSISAQRAADQTRVASLTRILARMRQEGGERLAEAEEEVARILRGINLEMLAMRKRADNMMLGGEFGRAMVAFTSLIARYPGELTSYAALARCILFFLFPQARKYLFNS